MPASKRSAQKTSKRAQPARDDDALTKRVRAALADVPGITERKMFGSTGFMAHDKLCITARESRLMLRIDPAEHDAALKREGCTTVLMKGREYRGYVFVAASAVATARALAPWLKQALDFNQRTFGTARAPSAPKKVPDRRAKIHSPSRPKPISLQETTRRPRAR